MRNNWIDLLLASVIAAGGAFVFVVLFTIFTAHHSISVYTRYQSEVNNDQQFCPEIKYLIP